MTGKLKTAILGATGYSGFELARILLRHPQVETPVMLQRSDETTTGNLADMFPVISGNGGYPLHPLSWSELERQKIELLFLATPHEVSRAGSGSDGSRDASGRPERRLAAATGAAPGGVRFPGRECGHGGRTHGESGLRAARVERRPAPRRSAGGQSGLLCHFCDSCPGSAPGRGHRGSGEGNYFRFEVGCFRARARKRQRALTSFRWRTICPPTRCSDTATWERFSSS